MTITKKIVYVAQYTMVVTPATTTTLAIVIATLIIVTILNHSLSNRKSYTNILFAITAAVINLHQLAAISSNAQP